MDSPSYPFKNRAEAGQLLGLRLSAYARQVGVLVLGLPRGGVPVAFEVARALRAPLDLLLVRKIGAPGQPELAMGAIASGGAIVRNEAIIQGYGISEQDFNAAVDYQRHELERRERLYRGDRAPLQPQGRTVIVVDDGLATGASMKAAVAALRQQAPVRIVVAVPVSAPDTLAYFQQAADETVCLLTPENLFAVGLWYEDFSPTTDDEVRVLLQRAAQAQDQPALRT